MCGEEWGAVAGGGEGEGGGTRSRLRPEGSALERWWVRAWKRRSARQCSTLHHDVALVRTGVTPSPARLRSKLCPAVLIRWSVSSIVRKSSNCKIHGSRCSTCTRPRG